MLQYSHFAVPVSTSQIEEAALFHVLYFHPYLQYLIERKGREQSHISAHSLISVWKALRGLCEPPRRTRHTFFSSAELHLTSDPPSPLSWSAEVVLKCCVIHARWADEWTRACLCCFFSSFGGAIRDEMGSLKRGIRPARQSTCLLAALGKPHYRFSESCALHHRHLSCSASVKLPTRSAAFICFQRCVAAQ